MTVAEMRRYLDEKDAETVQRRLKTARKALLLYILFVFLARIAAAISPHLALVVIGVAIWKIAKEMKW